MASIAFFITPHGFGHAARACAVMAALRAQRPDLQLHLYTRVPIWFFQDSLGNDGWQYHDCMTDIGMIQDAPTREDLPATVAALQAFLPFAAERLDALAADLHAHGCELVVCDIAPLGIAVARRAGLPSAVLENFTWQWIYRDCVSREPRLADYADQIDRIHAQADLHIQTEPVCHPPNPGPRVAPIGRTPRLSRASVRAQLGMDDQPLVLVSFGGIPPTEQPPLEPLLKRTDYRFVLMGAATDRAEQHANVWRLPHRSGWYHPDLVHAADLLIGKLGYSTVAEAWSADIAYTYLPRPGFCESAKLAEFIEAELGSQALNETEFLSGAWVARLDQLNNRPAQPRTRVDGAAAAAELLLGCSAVLSAAH